MFSFSSSDSQIIQAWLNGSKDYFTKISIVVRWNTAIPSSSVAESGEELDSRTGLSKEANPERDLEILQTAPAPQEQEIEDIYDVRFKRSGLKQDMSFRSPTLTFAWRGYYGFIQGKAQKAVRFYLKVALTGIGISNELVLMKTGFYKIREANPVYSTSRSQGADYTIEAVPWIYEYNDEMMFGSHGNAFRTDEYGDWDINTWDKDIAYFSSWNSVSRMQKIRHDLKNLKKGNYPEGPGEYFDDAPCSYTGPFYCEKSNSGIEWLSLQKMGMMQISDFITETPISMMQRARLVYSVAVPEIYRTDSPLDTPMMTFQVLKDMISTWGTVYNFPALYTFEEIENSDSEVVSDSLYSYSYADYDQNFLMGNAMPRIAVQLGLSPSGSLQNVFPMRTASIDFDGSEVSGIIDLSSVYFPDSPSASDSTKNTYKQAVVYSIEAFNSSGVSLGTTGQFESDGDKIRILYLPGDLQESISKLEINAYYGKPVDSKISIVEVDQSEDGNDKNVSIDTKTILMDDLISSSPSVYQRYVLYIYSNEIKKVVNFSAEFRPWINVFDAIRVRVMNSFGQYRWVRALVTDIDANLDSMSATYEGMVIEEE